MQRLGPAARPCGAPESRVEDCCDVGAARNYRLQTTLHVLIVLTPVLIEALLIVVNPTALHTVTVCAG